MSDLQCLKVSEVAALLGVSGYIVRKMIKSGELKSVRVSRSVRVLRSDLESLLGVETSNKDEETDDSEDTPADELRRFADRWKLNLIKR